MGWIAMLWLLVRKPNREIAHHVRYGEFRSPGPILRHLANASGLTLFGGFTVTILWYVASQLWPASITYEIATVMPVLILLSMLLFVGYGLWAAATWWLKRRAAKLAKAHSQP
jgi:hypothetical protein